MSTKTIENIAISLSIYTGGGNSFG